MIDLHMHSIYSCDGEYTPTELVERCAAEGISLMSVTDHNCARANAEAAKAAKLRNIAYIPGIEIDCVFKGTNFHMLGYGIDYKSRDFLRIEKNVDNQNFYASFEMLMSTQRLGFDVTESDMREISKKYFKQYVWTGEMFAEVLLNKKEYQNSTLLKPYRKGGARSDNPYVNFYWDFYSQGKPCYVEIKYPSMDGVIEMIHDNGGSAVLAHPGVNLSGREYLLQDILKLGIDGIEVYSSYHTAKQAVWYHKEALKRNMLVTCGSDYHGKTKPSVNLGSLARKAV
jgi:predicted metal-dependent phosphoesterase TrpH